MVNKGASAGEWIKVCQLEAVLILFAFGYCVWVSFIFYFCIHWYQAVNDVLGGRGGGKDLLAQGTSTNDNKVQFGVMHFSYQCCNVCLCLFIVALSIIIIVINVDIVTTIIIISTVIKSIIRKISRHNVTDYAFETMKKPFCTGPRCNFCRKSIHAGKGVMKTERSFVNFSDKAMIALHSTYIKHFLLFAASRLFSYL